MSTSPIHFGPAQTVLVTGATGFVGQHLVRALVADGHTVIALSRDAARAAARLGVRAIPSLEALAPSDAVDVVVHLAGARIFGRRWTAARKAVLRASRAGITAQIDAWIARTERKPRLLLAASAIGYYGVQAQDDARALDESAPPQPIFMSTLCQEIEAAAQGITRHGTQVGALRFGFVMGRGGALPGLLLPIRLGLGGPLAGGRQVLSWVHIDDLVRAIAHLMQAPQVDGAYNLCAPAACTQHEFARTAAAVLHRPCWFPTPGWPMRLLLGEQSDLVLEGQRVAPRRLQEGGFHFRFATLDAALADLCQ
ncbi:TIGR01777 family oxidoreductase [Massilia sp. TS11]|uniref:TIGR01777 family oxidoreductase n=1 Tax=Massilia sp. TS11 TaxID=2908003 RepID=UPI001ED9DD9A|nr:TIGR01777 family oxidoreductase [Massilia sp. TS11]MCG2585399.1 TIGR01777 family oxidoreductase [Massilia sp. TS11]